MRMGAVFIVVWLPLFDPPAALAACYSIALREFHVGQPADAFGGGTFAPLVALEPGRFYPLAPARSRGAPPGEPFEGQRYYLPRYLIDDRENLSLRLMVVERDEETPDDLVLPLTTAIVPLSGDGYDAGRKTIALTFTAFTDDVQPRVNRQRFIFEIGRHDGPCGENTPAGRAVDLEGRRNNDLKRLWKRIWFYDRPHLVGGREYRPYNVEPIYAPNLSQALSRAFEQADLNARELIALGRDVRELRPVDGFDRIWSDYGGLVRRLLGGTIPLHYKDDDGKKQHSTAPSLGIHSVWRNLRRPEELPVLPEDWGIKLLRSS